MMKNNNMKKMEKDYNIYVNEKGLYYTDADPYKIPYFSDRFPKEIIKRKKLLDERKAMVYLDNGEYEVFEKKDIEKKEWVETGTNLFYPLTAKKAEEQGWYQCQDKSWGHDPYPLC